jgi:hypothetical protein
MTTDDPTFDLTGALPFEDGADAVTPQKPGAGVLSAQFAYVGKGLTVPEFQRYCAQYNFGTIPPDYLILHHTAIPSTLAARYPSGAVWDAGEAGMRESGIYDKRKRQLDALMRYYRDAKGWPAGPHLFIDEKWIWLFTPMYDVGVHAAQGNSYRDSSRKLHYSIGIEVVGYYEKVHWTPAVAANVRGAVRALHDRLKTFQYIDKPWAGGISSHRDYNKPACPGAAIVPSYYMPILAGVGDGERPAHTGLTHYKVKKQVTGGATIRIAPRPDADMLGRLKAGDDWWGVATTGHRVSVPGFGSSDQWVCSDDQRCVSIVLLEKVKA